MKKLENSHT